MFIFNLTTIIDDKGHCHDLNQGTTALSVTLANWLSYRPASSTTGTSDPGETR